MEIKYTKTEFPHSTHWSRHKISTLFIIYDRIYIQKKKVLFLMCHFIIAWEHICAKLLFNNFHFFLFSKIYPIFVIVLIARKLKICIIILWTICFITIIDLGTMEIATIYFYDFGIFLLE